MATLASDDNLAPHRTIAPLSQRAGLDTDTRPPGNLMRFGWTAREVMSRLRREGWSERSGSDLHMFTRVGSAPIFIPRQGGEIPPGTLRSICHAAGWSYPPRH